MSITQTRSYHKGLDLSWLDPKVTDYINSGSKQAISFSLEVKYFASVLSQAKLFDNGIVENAQRYKHFLTSPMVIREVEAGSHNPDMVFVTADWCGKSYTRSGATVVLALAAILLQADAEIKAAAANPMSELKQNLIVNGKSSSITDSELTTLIEVIDCWKMGCEASGDRTNVSYTIKTLQHIVNRTAIKTKFDSSISNTLWFEEIKDDVSDFLQIYYKFVEPNASAHALIKIREQLEKIEDEYRVTDNELLANIDNSLSFLTVAIDSLGIR